MKKYFSVLLLFVSFIIHTKAQKVIGINKIEKTSVENEYLISTQISGLIDVDIAKVTYHIEDKHICKKTSSNPFLLSQKNNQVKFYVIAVPENGKISISFNITLSEKKDFIFPIRIEYSKDEDKKVAELPSIIITNELIASNNTKTNLDSEKEKLLAEQKAKEEFNTTRDTPNVEEKIYTVQILSLANYSEAKLIYYCKKHNINMNSVIKKNINGMTRISIGKFNTKQEAFYEQKRLAKENNITQSFVTVLP